MRGDESTPDDMFSYVRPEQRVPADHPLRPIRTLVDEVLRALSPRFTRLYAKTGAPPPKDSPARTVKVYRPRFPVKAEVSCPENAEVRCPLFTDVRVPWDYPGTPTSSDSAALGLRPRRPAFFFSRSR